MSTKNRYICESCGPVADTRVERRTETYPVKGEEISVLTNVRVCARCGQSVYDRELDSENIGAAYDLYRRNHNIISPVEIRAMREKYGLSQRSLGTLLGWGEITIHRYENGNLPDEAHNQVLQFIEDPFNMEYMMETYGHRLNQAAHQRVSSRLTELLSEGASEKVVRVLTQSAGRKTVDVFTGFREFRPEILMEMVVFYADRARGILKTKLNKLLWYADFVHFREHAVSISGATYVHLPYGPVPDNYGVYLASMCTNETLMIKEIDFGPNLQGEHIVGEQLIATREPLVEILPPSGAAVLESVYAYFEHMGSKEISKLSHEEDGYVNTQNGERISYEYADRLKVNIPLR